MVTESVNSIDTTVKDRSLVSSGGGDPLTGPGRRGPLQPEPFDGMDDNENAFRDKSKIITLFLLLVVLMTFGGLIGAYVVIATNDVVEWQPFSLPIPVWISTVLIIISSLSYELAKRGVINSDTSATRGYMLITSALGGMFIASQLMAWLVLVNRGFYLSGNPYSGFFYILTAIHAAHILGGIVALGAITLRTWYPTADLDEYGYRKALAISVGMYWHFMGFLWIVLFLLLGFWK